MRIMQTSSGRDEIGTVYSFQELSGIVRNCQELNPPRPIGHPSRGDFIGYY
jgi:hypothetical protein